MPKLDGKGPEAQGPQTGRRLGKCSTISKEETETKLGKGLGKKLHSGGGDGKGKRLQSGLK